MQPLLSITITTGTYQSFVDRILMLARQRASAYVCVANVHMLVEAHNNKDFAAIVNQADIVTPDGMPLAKSLHLLYNLKQDRVAGMDLLPDLLQAAQQQQLSVFFYGGTHQMLQATQQYLQHHYPLLQVAGMYSPPFRQLTMQEETATISHINNSNAHLVFVVLGCPKQEKWMAANKGKIQATMIGIGGALPVFIGAQKRAPRWMQQASLEWLYRLIQEPRRLFKRYAVTNTTFMWLLAKELIRKRILGKPQ